MRILRSRSFIITLVLAVGLSPVYLLPEYFFPLKDVTTQLYPFVLETKRMLSQGAPWWTWQSFLGDNFIGSYAYYTLTRPLLLALCLLPYKFIGAGMAAYIYVNFLIIGWLASCYLRMMGFGRSLRLIGSLLFTLSCYMICQLVYCMFFEPVQAFLLLLICIERFLRGRRFSLAALTLASFAVAIVNYYLMPATFIASALYFCCRVYACGRDRWLSLLLKAAGCVLLGTMMAAVVLVPVAMYISDVSRNGPYIVYGRNWVLRLLSLVAPTPLEGRMYLLLTDSGYNMNMAYLGIFGVLPFILYAVRHRHSWLTWLCTIYIVCLVTPLNGLFNLFTHPYYTRWSYALIMALVLVSLGYFREQRGRVMPRRAVMLYSLLSFLCLITVYSYSIFVIIYNNGLSLSYSWSVIIAAFSLFAVNTGALLMLSRWPVMSSKWTCLCVTSIVIASLLQAFSVSFSYAHKPLGEFNYYGIMRKLAQTRSDCDIFTARSYFESHPASSNPDSNLNIHLISNRPSITSYVSTVNPATADLSFLVQHARLWSISYDRYHESALALLSVKDFFPGQDSVFTEVPEAAQRGDRYIPMGIAYDRYSLMADSLGDIERAMSHDILRGMLASLLIDKADEPELSRYMSPVEFRDSLPFDSLVAARSAYTCDSFRGDSHGFTATISLPDTMVVMFSTAADPGFTATIDGKPSKIYNVNMGMSASIVPAGRHTIRYEYFPPGLRTGAILSLAGLLIFLGVALFEYRYKSKVIATGRIA